MAHAPARRFEASSLDRLILLLRDEGYAVIGPRERDGAIVYDSLETAADLPRGVSDEQQPGRYRLTRPGHAAYFGFAVGPHSWKRQLLPPARRQWTAQRGDDGSLDFSPDAVDETRRAFVGMRGCELAAIAIQDKVFVDGAYADPDYASRRASIALIAVQCTSPAATCFCTSMQTGPRVAHPCDLSLTEVEGDGEHFFLATAGSAFGTRLLDQLETRLASDADSAAAEQRLALAEQAITRAMRTDGLPPMLARSLDSPRWATVAERCLTCTNCTMVCPTCFCTTLEDVPLLDAGRAERWRRWDSCFTTDFSHIHGGAVRPSADARYRQWLTHKLGTWWDQFGSSGCVGCGRCITWCPVGIDITEEVAALWALDDDAGASASDAHEEA